MALPSPGSTRQYLHPLPVLAASSYDISMQVKELLTQWLERALEPEALTWLRAQQEKIQEGASERAMNLAVSLVPRKIGKADLALTEQDFKDADQARYGWTPIHWTTDQAARLLLVLSADWLDIEFPQKLEKLFITSDMAELVCWYRGLPLYPNPDAYEFRATEACRSNIKSVFEAVAHHNPYPSECFDERAWNHMVLKAIFIESTLHPMIGLDERCNPELTRMLTDYAHERWAASRSITIELWRCVGPGAQDDKVLSDLKRLHDTGDPWEQQAAVLAVSDCPLPGAKDLLSQWPELKTQMDADGVNWDTLTKNWMASKA